MTGAIRLRTAAAVVTVVAIAASGCSRSGHSSSSSSRSKASKASSGNATASGDFATLKAVCGPGHASGATDRGVTDHAITVGTMADPGAAAMPGLDQELFDTATAFVGWCNAAGGILGRKLALHEWDSKLTEVAARMIDACRGDFMLVGNGEALDEGGVAQRLACKLPEIPAYVVSTQAGMAPLSIQAIPISDRESPNGGPYRALKAFDPEAVKHYGLMSSTFQSVKDAGDRDRAAARTLGFTEVYYDELPFSVDNWRPYAQNLQTRGVQVVTSLGTAANTVGLLRALQDLGYHPKYAIFGEQYYDPLLISEGDGALWDGIYVATYVVPFELAATNPPTEQYIGLLQRYANGAKPKALGINAMSSWLLWAQAAKQCGSQLTRTCVMQHVQAVHTWDGGGLHAPSRPGNGNSPAEACFVLLQATQHGFVVDKRITRPDHGIFNCDPANAFPLR